ncbi:hypothetical protein [Streptomyces sp. NPDC005231]|uniref:hypothetical protein n=1 Tax=Streptomyces sp. NPDC005231 TaxID=3157026 RepID=UPI0033A94BEE
MHQRRVLGKRQPRSPHQVGVDHTWQYQQHPAQRTHERFPDRIEGLQRLLFG